MFLKYHRPDSGLEKGENRPGALPGYSETVAMYLLDKLMAEETRGVNRR